MGSPRRGYVCARESTPSLILSKFVLRSMLRAERSPLLARKFLCLLAEAPIFPLMIYRSAKCACSPDGGPAARPPPWLLCRCARGGTSLHGHRCPGLSKERSGGSVAMAMLPKQAWHPSAWSQQGETKEGPGWGWLPAAVFPRSSPLGTLAALILERRAVTSGPDMFGPCG